MINKKSIRINERDREVLLFIFRNKIVSFKQIHQFFFNGTHITAPGRRMNKLCNYKVIKKECYFIGRKSHVAYSITALGVNLIQPYLLNVVDSQRYNTDSLEHDLALGDITHYFSKLSIVKEVHSESELLSCSQFMENDKLLPFIELRSDRACLIKSAEGLDFLALEYERTIKSKERNRSKLESYYLQSSIPAVLYVCETDILMKSLMKIDSELCANRSSKLYFCVREDVHEGLKKITFTSFDKQTLSFI